MPVRRLTTVAGLLLIALLGTGCAGYAPQQTPTLALSTTSFGFKTVVIGQTVTQPLRVTNTGSAPLLITGLTISNKQFSITGPSVPRVILPANSLSYSVAFTPTASGNAAATLSIVTSASTLPASIALAGSGEKAFANLAIAPASINFGNLVLKSKSTQNVTLQNTGDINLSIQGVTLAGAGFGYADLSPGFSLAPNQKLTFQVWFSPGVTGPASAKVSFLSPNLSAPETLSLTGTGVTTTSPPPASVQHTVHLTWGASSSQVVGYRVYRGSVSGGSYAPLHSTVLTTLAYDDSTVASGTTYYYVVTAVDSSGIESTDSNQAVVVVPSP
jgi:hypothetical protein